jgi:starch synthase (maltosyl-transferring)
LRLLSWCRNDERPDLGAARDAGFDALLLTGLPADGGEEALRDLVKEADRAGAKLLLDVELDSFPIDHPLVEKSPEAFVLRRKAPGEGPVDPRRAGPAVGEARARLRDPQAAALVLPYINKRLASLARAGAAGFRILRPDAASSELLEKLAKGAKSELLFIAHAPGASRDAVAALGAVDAIVSSFEYWDFGSPWLAEEHEALRLTAPLLSEITAGAAERAFGATDAERLLRTAALMGNGLIVPHKMLADHRRLVESALELSRGLDEYDGEMRFVSVSSAATAVVRGDGPDLRTCDEALLGLINRSSEPALVDEAAVIPAIGAGFQPLHRSRRARCGSSPPSAVSRSLHGASAAHRPRATPPSSRGW